MRSSERPFIASDSLGNNPDMSARTKLITRCPSVTLSRLWKFIGLRTNQPSGLTR